MRKKIEEKLTEAMLRECVKCGYRFVKLEGCNMITYKFGGKMCYLCMKNVKELILVLWAGRNPYCYQDMSTVEVQSKDPPD